MNRGFGHLEEFRRRGHPEHILRGKGESLFAYGKNKKALPVHHSFPFQSPQHTFFRSGNRPISVVMIHYTIRQEKGKVGIDRKKRGVYPDCTLNIIREE
jgi:ubiquitin-protein ligase